MHAMHAPVAASQTGASGTCAQSSEVVQPVQTSATTSQTGAAAVHPSVSHDDTTQVFPTHFEPAAHARCSSETQKRAQSAGSVQQNAGFGSVVQPAESASENAIAAGASARRGRARLAMVREYRPGVRPVARDGG